MIHVKQSEDTSQFHVKQRLNLTEMADASIWCARRKEFR